MRRRDPADVRRIYNVVGAIGPARGGPGLTGDLESWVAALADWSIELGGWPASDAAGHKVATNSAHELHAVGVTSVHERLQDRRVLRRRFGVEFVQRRESRQIVRLAPAALRAALLVRADEVELARAIGAGLT